MPREISIIIVNYNSGELLSNCLTSIQKELTVDYEVVVVDNASTDGSMEQCAAFKDSGRFVFHSLGENLGFAAACNIGANLSTGDVLHFLNPDTELKPGANSDYLRVLENPGKVYVTPLVNRDGSAENDRMVLPVLRDIFWWNLNRKRARFWCKGASVILSRGNFIKVGRWSEDYFMYGEDLDLFYQFWKHDLEISLLTVPVYHLGGGCSQKVWNPLEREIKVQRSFRKFYDKYFTRWQYVAVKLYFLVHNLIKHPAKVKGDIKAWSKV
ncbi:MAG: glycosyltransferase family 2 protein [Bacteroidales bacterium]|nr:glycosyltransferase family 2 protein [Bacteroidales bacterium]MBO7321510.1 glycosyltransferase family 2 protein [Bacteroidales bacterium]